MKVESIKCPNCGGGIEFFDKDGICSFCGQPYKIEDTNSDDNVENKYAGHLNGDRTVESQIRAADAFIKLGDYESAKKKYSEIVENHPDVYQGWWGLIRVCTCDFKKTILTCNEFHTIRNYYQNAEIVCDDISKIKVPFSTYKERTLYNTHQYFQKLESQIIDEEKQLEIEKRKNAVPIANINNEIDSLNQNINRLNNEIKQVGTEPDYFSFNYVIIIAAVLFEILGVINGFSEHHLFSGFVSAILVFLGWIPGLIVGPLISLIVLLFAKRKCKFIIERNERIKMSINKHRYKLSGLNAKKSQLESSISIIDKKIKDLKKEKKKYDY